LEKDGRKIGEINLRLEKDGVRKEVVRMRRE
jgi:hypothetical protein